MGAPRFEPRKYCSTPELFGRYGELEWPAVSDGERVLQRDCAQLQHRFSLAVRLSLKERGTTLRKYAAELGLDYGRLGRVMRGEIVMKLEDIMRASRRLGLELTLSKRELEHQPMS